MEGEPIHVGESSLRHSVEIRSELYGTEVYDNESSLPVPSQQDAETQPKTYGSGTEPYDKKIRGAAYDGGTSASCESIRRQPTHRDEVERTDLQSADVPNNDGAYSSPEDVDTATVTDSVPFYADHEETEVKPPVTDDCSDDPDSHVYYDIKDEVTINNLQQTRKQHGGQSTGTAADGSTTPANVGLAANPLYGGAKQPDKEDSSFCGFPGRCNEAFSRRRVFLAVIIFIAAASFCWALAALIMHLTVTPGNKEDAFSPSVTTATSATSAWQTANRATSAKLSATSVILDKSIVPSSTWSTKSSRFMSTTTMSER
ncbi:uncharacterized protein [Branchiostoma lanceolatum]|uniref:uncharacterized protein n=1 Tax=Branchiostoma lanceolatum TaxID=7740 RepID=UPI00345326F1